MAALALAKTGLNLVTSFKFEVGAALTQSDKLTNSLRKVSDQAQLVQDNLKFTTIKASKVITGLEGGILSFTKNLVNMSEDLYASQLKLATLMSGNQKKLRIYTPVTEAKAPDQITLPIPGVAKLPEAKVPDKITPTTPGVTKLPTDFNAIMDLSESVLKRSISNLTSLGIAASDAKYTFSEIAALLIPKGAAGPNMQNVEKMTRNVLLGASTLNMSPAQAAGQIQTLIQGRAMEGFGIFDRLKAETEEFSKTTASSFNRLIRTDKTKGIEKINKAFDQYLNKTGRLEAHYKQLSVQLTMLRNKFQGISSPFLELGKTIRKHVIDLLMALNKMLDVELPKFAKGLSTIFRMIVRDVEWFYVQLKKTASLGATFEKSFNIAAFIGVLSVSLKFFGWITTKFVSLLAVLGLINKSTSKFFFSLNAVALSMKAFSLSFAGISKIFTFGFTFLFGVLTKFRGVFFKLLLVVGTGILNFLTVFAAVFTFFRVFDSAKAQAEAMDIKQFKLGGDLAKFAVELGIAFNNLITPFRMLIDYIGGIIAPLFSVSFWLQALQKALGQVGVASQNIVKVSDNIAKDIVGLFTYISVYVSFIVAHIKNILTHAFALDFQGLIENFNMINQSLEKVMINTLMKVEEERRHQSVLRKEKPEVAQNLISINKVEIRNQFPENIEPDRIATSIVDSFTNQINQIDTTSRPQTYHSGSLSSGAGLGG